MEKIYNMLDAMKAAALRDNHDALWAEYEDYLANMSAWGAWDDEGKRHGEPQPDSPRPTQKELREILAFHGYKWNARTQAVTK